MPALRTLHLLLDAIMTLCVEVSSIALGSAREFLASEREWWGVARDALSDRTYAAAHYHSTNAKQTIAPFSGDLLELHNYAAFTILSGLVNVPGQRQSTRAS